MEKESKYNEADVAKSLSKKKDAKIDVNKKLIVLSHGHSMTGDIGIGSKGKIDFLTKYCGWTKMWA